MEPKLLGVILMAMFGAPGMLMIFAGIIIYNLNAIHINPVTEKRRKMGLKILHWGGLLALISFGIGLYGINLAKG